MAIPLYLVTAALLAAPAPALPAPAPPTRVPAGERLSHGEVLRQAVRLNRDLKRASLDLAKARQDVRAAKGTYDTVLSAGVSYEQSTSVPVEGLNIQTLRRRALDYSLSASQKLPTGGTVTLGLGTSWSSSTSRFSFGTGDPFENQSASWNTGVTLTVKHPLLKGIGMDVNMAAIRQAKLARDAVRWTVHAKARAVVRDLLKAYLDVVEAEAAVRVQLEAVAQAERDLKRVRALEGAGRMAPLELVDYRFAVAQQQRLLLEARTTWLQASLALRLAMGQKIEPGRQLVSAALPTSPHTGALPTAKQASRAALGSSRELAAAKKELQINRITLTTTKRDTWPSLDLTASVGPMGQSDKFGGAHETMLKWKSIGWSVGLSFSYLVGNRAAKAAAAKARLEVKRKQVDIAALRQTLVAEATKTVALLKLQQKLMATTRAEVALARLRLDNERKKKAAGRSSAYVLLQIQNDLTKARHKAFSARVGFLKRRIELAALMGDLLPRWGLHMSKGAGVRVGSR